MLKYFVKKEQIKDNYIYIGSNDSNHIKNVLRKKIGDKLYITDDLQNTFECEISEYEDKKLVCKILSSIEDNKENDIEISLFQCIAKFDKMDYIIQKATELGVNTIYPVISKRVIVKLDEKTKNKKIERWKAIASEACKQCKRTKIPKIESVFFFKDICNLSSTYDIILVAYENDKHSLKQILQNRNINAKNIAVVIGPEGGFEENEIEEICNIDNVYVVSLGKRILRTETASISLISNILYEFNEI